MEESIYSKLPKLKIELNLVSLVGIVLVVIFGFIIPVSLIENGINNNTVNQGAQVAGVSTTKEEQKPTISIFNQNVSLEGQSGILIVMGLFLIGVCFFIVLFLIIDSIKQKRSNF